MKKVAIVIIIVLGTPFFLIGIPLIINMSYKCGTVIITTEWDASDVLAYYGTLLATTTTVVALVGTIQFTRKQIQHDQFLEKTEQNGKKLSQLLPKHWLIFPH